MKWDAFISHASEDKGTFVKELASSLKKLGLNVWYDEFELSIGDSLSRSIDKGLSKSNFGIVVISAHFIKKPWPEYELRGLTAKEMGRDKVILPIWHNVTRDEVLSFSSTLSDKFALDTSKLKLEDISFELLKAIRPEIYQNFMRLSLNEKMRQEMKGEAKYIDPSMVYTAPIQHETLEPHNLLKIKILFHVLSEVYPVSLEDSINLYRRDGNPDREIFYWEYLAATYLDLNHDKFYSLDQKKELFRILLTVSSGMKDPDAAEGLNYFGEEDVSHIRNKFHNIIPPIPDCDNPGIIPISEIGDKYK